MGNLFSIEISGDSVLNRVGSCLCGKDNHILNLEKNLEALEKAIGVLKAKRDDVLIDVQREEAKGQRRLNQVQVWLTSVQTIENQFDDLNITRTMELQRLCLFGVCSKNFKSSFRYGRRVSQMSTDIENLKTNGVFEVVAAEQPTMRCVVEERPLQPVIVGQETMLERAWNRLMDDETGIMGFNGMGGVVKTTLLKQINNKFCEANYDFEIVIWVVVSSDLRVEKIRADIAEELGLRRETRHKVTDIHAHMKNKKFVLLLDDIWRKVDLTEIGVPFPTRENGCKVVFTTRSREVCGRMGVDDPMEVRCLTNNEAWNLFEKKVGQLTLKSHPSIPEQARKVAEKCRGLPLALSVIGETMSSKRTIQEWDHAVQVLNSYAADFAGMDDQILPILKYSYDNLKDDHIKSCFLYCSLFTEDYLIEKEKLIDHWICERFINENEDRERTVNQGYDIIGTLVRSCLLLEEGSNKSKVKMHDVVREMALWISSDLGDNREKCIVRAGVGLCEVPKVEKWSAVERMSLMNNKIEKISASPKCRKLTTLFLQENKLLTSISGCTVLGFDRSWKELLLVKHLEVLTIEIKSKMVLEELFSSHMGMRCIQKVVITDTLEESFGTMNSLTILRSLKGPCFKSLEYLGHLEEVVNIEKANEMQVKGIIPFGKLETLLMIGLIAVESIYWTPLPFPCLREMYIEHCPKLKKLPLNSKSVAEVERKTTQRGMLICYKPSNRISVSIVHCSKLSDKQIKGTTKNVAAGFFLFPPLTSVSGDRFLGFMLLPALRPPHLHLLHPSGAGDIEIESAIKSGENPGLGFGLGQKRSYNYIHKYGYKSKLMAVPLVLHQQREIGVPFPTRENGCKVVFTTRSREVCGYMGVDDPMEVQCLTHSAAWDLFKKKVGPLTLKSHPRIPEQARKVAEKCGGLPLALSVIGETMSCKRTIKEWDLAVEAFAGMDDQILPILKYSYDNLKGEQIKSCFQYCSLFPEDNLIEKEKLIDYWICERFIGENEDRERTVNQGYGIIATLVSSCLLLEEGSSISKVKMHDVVREMALGISSDFGKKREKCIVRAGVGLSKVPKVEKWSAVERMSLMRNKIEGISGSPECPELTTLFLQENSAYISSGFFKHMPKLVVLDLSQNDSVFLNCRRKYQKRMRNLESIDGISMLSSLRRLKLLGSHRVQFDKSSEELLLLKHLEVLTIEIGSNMDLEKLFFSQIGRKCIQKVVIRDIFYFPTVLRSLKGPCFLSLSYVTVKNCGGLKDLTLLLCAPNLIQLHLVGLEELEEVANIEKAKRMQVQGIIPFGKLETLVMLELPEVKSTYWTPLPFPCLREMHIEQCPKLRKLPLNSRSVAEVERFVIQYAPENWIGRVEWEDEATRLRFLPSRRIEDNPGRHVGFR
ncbi:hypothetical protein DY000_02057833 [Brassica cretica]|uniref:NB-ARC domain-containing protein n=1 Tax=Brassica cretica TaxID=69181 RepID=A0ABQ7AI69_BRACR|nr:hypothetical protein DY000_02057833 [Brassica cretica]